MTDHSQHKDEGGGAGRWIFWGFALIAGFFLLTEHRAHVFQFLPLVLVLACPLMHLLHGRGHGGHGSAGVGARDGSDTKRADGEKKQAGGCH